MKQKHFSVIGFTLALAVLLVQFQNCSDVAFSTRQEEKLPPLDACDFNPALCIEDRTPVLVNNTIMVQPPTNAVDILFVVDNSGSMGPQLQQLGQRFPTFIASLSNLDWRVCVTSTDVANNGQGRDGRLFSFGNNNNQLWLDSSVNNANNLFLNRMNNVGNGSGDERGIYAINRALQRDEGCFRPNAALSTVIISDEDERSAGGLPGNQQTRTLQPLDFPNSVFDTLALEGYAGKIYTNHSIIIRPAVPELGLNANDQACYDDQEDEGHPAWYGTHYAELTRLTKGILGDICAPDYGAQLSFIGQNIANSLNSVALECEPVNAQGVKITNANSIIVSGKPANVTATLAGNKLNFNPPLPGGTTLNLSYYCLR